MHSIIRQVITPCLRREAVVGFNSQVLDLRPGNLCVAEALGHVCNVHIAAASV